MKVIREGLFNKAQPEQRPEGSEGGVGEPPGYGAERAFQPEEQQVQRPQGSGGEGLVWCRNSERPSGCSSGERGQSWIPKVGEETVRKVP